MQAQRTTSTTPQILVTGGTGTLGRQVVDRLRADGRPVRLLSRRNIDAGNGTEHVQGDLESGAGVEAAVAGVDTILHLAGSQKGDDVKARHLVEAATGSGVRHIVFISVVGADRIPIRSAIDRAMFGYFGAKHAAERIIAESGVPWTTQRATQFHDLTLATVEQMAKLPIVPVPAGWRFQPIDSGEVAERLVELAKGSPAGFVPAIGGPEIFEMTDLVRSYLEAVGKRQRSMIRLPLPGKAAAIFREGANLVPDRAIGRRTWREFLESRFSARAAAPASLSSRPGH